MPETRRGGTKSPTNAQIIAAIKESRGLIAVAARRLGINRLTVYRRMEKYPAVRQAVDDEREFSIDLAEAKLYEAINKGESWAIALMLRTLGRSRGYEVDQKVQHSGTVEVNANVRQVRDRILNRIDEVAGRTNGASAAS